MGGTDLNSNSTGSFRSTYHTIVERYIANTEFNNGLYKWFYGAGVNGEYSNALSAFEWDDKYL